MKKKSASPTKSKSKKTDSEKASPPNIEESSTTTTTAEVTEGVVPAEPVPEDDLQVKFNRLSKQHDRVKKANERLHKFQNKVAQSTQAHRSATAQLKSDIGDRDKAALELQRIIDDVKSGQQVLPGTEEDDETPTSSSQSTGSLAGEAENWPISELGTKRLTAIVGAEVVAAAKNSDDPIGLSDKQLEILEQAEWPTIGDLEKAMREDSWWHKKVAKDPAAQIIQRVTSTLLAFRKVHPHAEKPATVVEKLAAANEADSAANAAEKTEPASAA